MADVFDDEAEQTVSIGEYLQNVEEAEQQELEADLVLGGDEGKECTYSKGYMKRQAIFSCLTCVPDGNAGVCTACSLICHDGHEIVELWTKRNFKCDCGNSKFGGFYCKLLANKDPENSENSYNQNFKGSYCTCGRPYPDPDVEDQVEMIQCCICEDWFHENHLGLQSSDELPKDGEGEPSYEDFICQSCAAKFSFLTLYPPTVWAPVSQTTVPLTSGTEGNVLPWTVSTGTSSKVENGVDTPNPKSEAASESSDGAASEISNGDKLVLNGDSSETRMGSNECTQPTVSSGKCFLQVDLSSVSEKITPLFLAKNWRDLLCRCEVCAKFYSQSGIGFLIDREDSIAEYEKMATQKRQEKLQQQEGDELNFLNNLGHVEKMEFLSGINDMKDEFRSFLESADTSKPITSADVQQIFENLAKKRQRLQ